VQLGHCGKPVRLVQALVRSVVMSVWLFVVMWSPLGWFRKDRRHVQDMLACTSVIYAWNARSFQLQEEQVSEAEKLGPEFSTFDLMSGMYE
jgi:uncharacterized RDD family membrane protein YckC